MIVYFVGSTNDPIISACVQNYECAPMTLSIKIAKFKFHQYVLRAVFTKFIARQSFPLYSIENRISTVMNLQKIASFSDDTFPCFLTILEVIQYDVGKCTYIVGGRLYCIYFTITICE